MSDCRVDFGSMEWQEIRPGARHKRFSDGTRQLRLVEFSSGDVDPHWCDQGHIGLVLSGALEIEVDGSVVRYAEGDGIFIPSGSATAHRARSIAPGTRLVMVEDTSQ
jgi:quercetin dioxygenase-like cupin family protein